MYIFVHIRRLVIHLKSRLRARQAQLQLGENKNKNKKIKHLYLYLSAGPKATLLRQLPGTT